MGVIAVIPARGGSRGVPRKNLHRVGGVPLVVRAIRAAQRIEAIDGVAVSTDDPAIADLARAAGAIVIDRPAELSGDSASSETALLHAFENLLPRPTVLVFLQATSPFQDDGALRRAIETVATGRADAVFSAIGTHEFLWQRDASGIVGVNHDPSSRPRRQDRPAEFRETGAFYVLDAAGFTRAGHRFFGRIELELVDPLTAIEIDDYADLDRARQLAPLADRALQEIIDVDAVATDFDGVHTDDRAVIDSVGSEMVTVSRSDGMGVGLLRTAGIPMFIVSSEANPVVAARARKLEIEFRQGRQYKRGSLEKWSRRINVPLERIAYLGNDVNDLSCMEAVGWPIAVADAHPEVLRAARVILDTRGGQGAVRELADRVLRGRTTSENTREWEQS